MGDTSDAALPSHEGSGCRELVLAGALFGTSGNTSFFLALEMLDVWAAVYIGAVGCEDACLSEVTAEVLLN